MCGPGQTEEQKEQKKANEEIDKQLKQEKVTKEKEIKMLLLGEKKTTVDGLPSTLLLDARFDLYFIEFL